jgi:hypothetical protein
MSVMFLPKFITRAHKIGCHRRGHGQQLLTSACSTPSTSTCSHTSVDAAQAIPGACNAVMCTYGDHWTAGWPAASGSAAAAAPATGWGVKLCMHTCCAQTFHTVRCCTVQHSRTPRHLQQAARSPPASHNVQLPGTLLQRSRRAEHTTIGGTAAVQHMRTRVRVVPGALQYTCLSHHSDTRWRMC